MLAACVQTCGPHHPCGPQREYAEFIQCDDAHWHKECAPVFESPPVGGRKLASSPRKATCTLTESGEGTQHQTAYLEAIPCNARDEVEITPETMLRHVDHPDEVLTLKQVVHNVHHKKHNFHLTSEFLVVLCKKSGHETKPLHDILMRVNPHVLHITHVDSTPWHAILKTHDEKCFGSAAYASTVAECAGTPSPEIIYSQGLKTINEVELELQRRDRKSFWWRSCGSKPRWPSCGTKHRSCVSFFGG